MLKCLTRGRKEQRTQWNWPRLTKKEFEQAKGEVQKQIEKGRQEAQAIITQAMQVGERLKEESRQEAAKQAQVIIDRARSELEAERDKIVGDLRREFVDISISAAEKVIKETLDKEKHRKLIEETLQESVTLRKS